MSRNFAVCQDGFLRLGYATVSFPYMIEQPSGGLRGILIDYFADATRLLGCPNGPEYVKFPTNATENDNYFNGTIERGELFTSAAATYMFPSDFHQFDYTVPIIMNLKIVFLERLPAFSLDTALIFYTVFEYDALLAILLAFLLITFIEFLQRRLRKDKEKSTLLELLGLPGASLTVLGVTLLFFVYQAKYNGNNMVTSKDAKSIQTSLSLVGLGQERFIFPDGSIFTEEEVEAITNGHAYTMLDEESERLRDLCEHLPRSTLGAFYASEVLSFAEMDDLSRVCRLTSVPFDPRAPHPSSLPWLHSSMATGDNYLLVTSKRMPRRAVETLNQLILGVYNYEQQSGRLLRKFVPKLELAQQILNGEPDFSVDESPFSMLQMEIPLIFLAVGLSVSFAALLIEVLLSRIRNRMNCFPKCFCCKFAA